MTETHLERLVNKMTLNSSPSLIVLKDNDRLAQYVNFSGKSETLVEPHSTIPGVENRMDFLWSARWGEYVVESHLRQLGPLGDMDTKLSNTPIQLYLMYCRLIRARLEIDIYYDTLSRRLPSFVCNQLMPVPAEQFLQLVQRGDQCISAK